MAEIKLLITEDYIPDLVRRMEKYKISQNALAKEMTRIRQAKEGWTGRPEDGPRISATQANRWFTENPARRVMPEMATAILIEEAVESLRKRRARS